MRKIINIIKRFNDKSKMKKEQYYYDNRNRFSFNETEEYIKQCYDHHYSKRLLEYINKIYEYREELCETGVLEEACIGSEIIYYINTNKIKNYLNLSNSLVRFFEKNSRIIDFTQKIFLKIFILIFLFISTFLLIFTP